MGYFRILLIPLFSWMYCTADSTGDYYAAAVVVGVSGLTDMFDGKIARRFHMITELGKFIDPLADKLTQAALLICLAIRYPLMRAVLVLFVIKEGFMAVMGALLLPRGKKLDGAMWFGKVCTAVLYAVLFLLLLLPGIGATAANVLIGICGAFLLFSFLMYIPVSGGCGRKAKGTERKDGRRFGGWRKAVSFRLRPHGALHSACAPCPRPVFPPSGRR